jgi:CBS domain containing-hemolysin-like protein
MLRPFIEKPTYGDNDMTRFRPLHRTRLLPGTLICPFDSGLSARVEITDPALAVMTDLRRVPAVTIPADSAIDVAMQRMMHAGVRLLLVLGEYAAVVGLVTARDIMGEKPVRIAAANRIPRDAVKVGEIMVPEGQIEVLDLAEVGRSAVGDVVLTLREAGRQHALVMEAGDPPQIRGIFSISQIGRQLGVKIQSTAVVQSFAELEHLLVNSS